MRLINAHAIPWRLSEDLELYVTKAAILEMPTVDAVPVVRCKDCTHYRVYMGRDMCAKNAQVLDGHEVGLHATGKHDFCSHGKRREA